MIPRVRPFFHRSYIDSVNNFELSSEREGYLQELSRKFERYYPNAKAFEYFDYGKSSLSAGLSVLDFQEGDEILVPCFTCSTILEPILSMKCRPVLYDIEYDFNINIDQLSEKVTQKTRAILVTHFFGIPSNINEIKDFADVRGIYIIEDCAHCIGSEIDNVILGNIGDLSFTSFGNDKPISIGNGSLLILNNMDFLGRFHEIIPGFRLNEVDCERNSFLSLLFFYLCTEKSIYKRFIGVDDFYHYFATQGSKADFYYRELLKRDLDPSMLYQVLPDCRPRNPVSSIFCKVMNYLIPDRPELRATAPKRMNSFSLNVLNNAVDYIDELNAFRKEIGSLYVENFLDNNEIVAPISQKNVPFLRYPIFSKKPATMLKIVDRLNLNGYECGNFNWSQPLNKILNISEKFEHSEFIAKNIINLPCHFSMNESDVFDICETINIISS